MHDYPKAYPCMIIKRKVLPGDSWSPDPNEPPHDKTNKVDQSLLCTQWVAKGPKLSSCGSETSLGAQSFCWFCHEVAQIILYNLHALLHELYN